MSIIVDDVEDSSVEKEILHLSEFAQVTRPAGQDVGIAHVERGLQVRFSGRAPSHKTS